LMTRRESLPPGINPGTLTLLAGFPTERLHWPDRKPPVESFAIDRG